MKGAPRRFPLQPLIDIIEARHAEGVDVYTHIGAPGRLGRVAGTNRATVHRWLQEGTITQNGADRCAIALGYHPGEIWPEWWDLADKKGAA